VGSIGTACQRFPVCGVLASRPNPLQRSIDGMVLSNPRDAENACYHAHVPVREVMTAAHRAHHLGALCGPLPFRLAWFGLIQLDGRSRRSSGVRRCCFEPRFDICPAWAPRLSCPRRLLSEERSALRTLRFIFGVPAVRPALWYRASTMPNQTLWFLQGCQGLCKGLCSLSLGVENIKVKRILSAWNPGHSTESLLRV
jgi:hypothetical protein